MKIRTLLLAVIFTINLTAQSNLLKNPDFTDWGWSFGCSWGPNEWWFEGDWNVEGKTDPTITKGDQPTYPNAVRFQGYSYPLHNASLHQLVNLETGKYEANLDANIGWPTTPFFIKIFDSTNTEVAIKNTDKNGAYQLFTVEFEVQTAAEYKIWIGAIGAENTQMLVKNVSLIRTADLTTANELIKIANLNITVNELICVSTCETIKNITLTNMSGNLVISKNINSNYTEIEKPQQKGIYFINIETANKKETVKIMI